MSAGWAGRLEAQESQHRRSSPQAGRLLQNQAGLAFQMKSNAICGEFPLAQGRPIFLFYPGFYLMR